MAHDVPVAGAHLRAPARALARVVPAGVEAQAGDDEERVARAAVRRDPRPLPGLAPRLVVRAGQLRVDEPAAVQRVGLRAGAVVAGVLPAAVTAAVLVRLGPRAGRRLDDPLALGRRVRGRDRLAVRAERGLAGGGGRL